MSWPRPSFPRPRDLDAKITEASEEWTADRLGALERNVLRIGIYELEEGDVPVEVAIDEAVSLAKRYASDEAGRLVNGILGRVAQGEGRVMTGAEDALTRAEELLDRLERTRERLEGDGGPRGGDRHPRRARRDREAGRDRARAGAARGGQVVPSLDEHRALIEDYLAELPVRERARRADRGDALQPRRRRQADPAAALPRVRRGDRIADRDELLPAAAAVELVHTFGMVHDDLPALDDDAIRRGRATSHVQFDEATAILNGDALLAQAMELALSYPDAGRRARAGTGDARDDRRPVRRHRGGSGDLARRHALKTGRLFEAAVGCALAVSEVPEDEQVPWRGFAAEFGLLFQVVDDVLDEDGLAAELGSERTHELAAEIEQRARARLDEIPADTSLLDELVSGLKSRVAAS